MPNLSRLRRRLFDALNGPTAMGRWRWLLAGLVMVVSWLALSPAPPDGLDTGWDKLNHAGAFAVLTLVASFAFPRSRHSLWLVLAGLLCYGAAIEVAQSFTPTRSAEWGDLLADLIGMAAGAMLAMLIDRVAGERSQSD